MSEALRWCWYRNPIFSSTLFTESVRRWFGLGCDIRMLTSFLSRLCAAEGLGGSAFPSREAEAVMRAALGEVDLLEAVHPAQFSYPEIGIAVLRQLFMEWQPDPEQVEILFGQVEDLLKQADAMSSELRHAEEDWFAAGMPDSPFAQLAVEVPVDPNEER